MWDGRKVNAWGKLKHDSIGQTNVCTLDFKGWNSEFFKSIKPEHGKLGRKKKRIKTQQRGGGLLKQAQQETRNNHANSTEVHANSSVLQNPLN